MALAHHEADSAALKTALEVVNEPAQMLAQELKLTLYAAIELVGNNKGSRGLPK